MNMPKLTSHLKGIIGMSACRAVSGIVKTLAKFADTNSNQRCKQCQIHYEHIQQQIRHGS